MKKHGISTAASNGDARVRSVNSNSRKQAIQNRSQNCYRDRRRQCPFRWSCDGLLARTCIRSHTCRASDSCYRVRLGRSSSGQTQRENQLEDCRESNLIEELSVLQKKSRHLVLPAPMNSVGEVLIRVG